MQCISKNHHRSLPQIYIYSSRGSCSNRAELSNWRTIESNSIGFARWIDEKWSSIQGRNNSMLEGRPPVVVSAEKHQPDNTNGWCSCWTRLSPELFVSQTKTKKNQSLSVPQKEKKNTSRDKTDGYGRRGTMVRCTSSSGISPRTTERALFWQGCNISTRKWNFQPLF